VKSVSSDGSFGIWILQNLVLALWGAYNAAADPQTAGAGECPLLVTQPLRRHRGLVSDLHSQRNEKSGPMLLTKPGQY